MRISPRLVVTCLVATFTGAAGRSQTVTTSGGTTNAIAKYTGSTTIGTSSISEVNGSVGIGTGTPRATLDVSGSAIVHGSGLTVGSGPFINLTDAYLQATGSAGEQAGMIVDRGDSNQFGSFDLLTSGNASSGWSMQMQPGKADLAFVDRAAQNMPNRLTLRSSGLEINGGLILTANSGASITFADGTVQATAFAGCAGGDYAEAVDVSDNKNDYEPGDLIAIDPNASGRFIKASTPYSRTVAGVYSTKPGFVGRRQLTPAAKATTEIPMAMVGIVPTKVSAENGSISVGDLLVASSTAGYAMKGDDQSRLTGAVIGKALGSLKDGIGNIEVLISLQ